MQYVLDSFDCFTPMSYPKYVISLDDVDMSHDGISHLNLIDFLMDNDVI